MGFKSKQVSIDTSNNSSHPPLNCPRCNSINTKFCYYNNYNETQPRHFCRSCKRHWTQGGTLRDVPVGGARRNKRLKTSNTTSSPAVDNMQQQYEYTLGTNTFLMDSVPSLPNFFLNNFTPFNDTSCPFSVTYPYQFQPSNLDEVTQEEMHSMSSSTITINTTSEIMNPSWELPSTSGMMDSLSDWSFDELNLLISATSTTDIDQAWDDLQIEQHEV